MNEVNMETLSAAMDGELSREELRFLLRRLDHDTSLLQVWARYHVAGDGLRRQVPGLAAESFAVRVMQAVEGEPAVSGRAPSGRRDWLRLSIGGAIAASVAVAALIVSQPTGPDATRRPEPSLAANAAARGMHVAARAMDASSRIGSMPAAVPPWLSAYSASDLSQRASVTLGDPSDNPLFQRYPVGSERYPMSGYQTVDGHNGSYLLLIDTPQAAARQVAAGH